MNGKIMADKLGLGPEIRELKLGSSFSNSKGSGFHTLRYDFKPASVDENKVATLDVGANHQVTVTVPHLDGAGTMQTVFKGSHKPYQRECVLIIDRNTGEITLEKLSANIQLKKTRMESHKQGGSGGSGYSSSANHLSVRPATPTEKKTSPPRQSQQQQQSSRQSHKLPKTLSASVPRHSPLHASPSYAHKSPTTSNHIVHKSPPQISLSPAVPGSLPCLDDLNDNSLGFLMSNTSADIRQSPEFCRLMDGEDETTGQEVGVLSDSSSDSSSECNSSDSDSDSSSRCNNDSRKRQPINGHLNGTIDMAVCGLNVPEQLLTEDLQLSESCSDSD